MTLLVVILIGYVVPTLVVGMHHAAILRNHNISDFTAKLRARRYVVAKSQAQRAAAALRDNRPTAFLQFMPDEFRGMVDAPRYVPRLTRGAIARAVFWTLIPVANLVEALVITADVLTAKFVRRAR